MSHVMRRLSILVSCFPLLLPNAVCLGQESAIKATWEVDREQTDIGFHYAYTINNSLDSVPLTSLIMFVGGNAEEFSAIDTTAWVSCGEECSRFVTPPPIEVEGEMLSLPNQIVWATPGRDTKLNPGDSAVFSFNSTLDWGVELVPYTLFGDLPEQPKSDDTPSIFESTMGEFPGPGLSPAVSLQIPTNPSEVAVGNPLPMPVAITNGSENALIISAIEAVGGQLADPAGCGGLVGSVLGPSMAVSCTLDLTYSQSGIHKNTIAVSFEAADGRMWNVAESNQVEVLAMANCDLNGDGECLRTDIDVLVLAARLGSTNADFDLTMNGVVDAEDVAAWLIAANTFVGDANVDGQVDFADFLIVSDGFGKPQKGWSEGDFSLDGEVGFEDFLLLSANFGKGPRQTASVPEPTSIGLALLAMLSGVLAIRQK